MKYDLVFLLNEEAELSNLKKLIESLTGTILEEQAWGKKTLAYPVKKTKSANYYFWKIQMDKKNIAELRKKLNFDQKLLRYLLLIAE